MVIREAGLLFRGFTLVSAQFQETGAEKIDKDLRSGLLTAILSFAECAFDSNTIEYFEGKKFVIAFIHDKINAHDSIDPELFVGYAILSKQKKIGKYIRKNVIPSLQLIILQFKSMFEGKNLSEVSQFKEFESVLGSTFGNSTKKTGQKLEGVFY